MILIDTQIVVWLAADPKRLSSRAAAAIREAREFSDGVAIASVTLYELAWLVAMERIIVSTSPHAFLLDVQSRFVVRQLTALIASRAVEMSPSFPKDPMDRIIGATAIVEGLKLVTADGLIRRSKLVDTIW